MTSLKRLGTLVRGSSQAVLCLATPRLPVEHCKNWTRHRPFDDINSCRGRLIWTSQTATPLDKPLFLKNSRCNKWCDLTHRPVQHLQCNTRAWLHCKAESSEELTLQQVAGLNPQACATPTMQHPSWLHCKAEPSKFYLRQLTEVGQTARERTKSIGVRPSSESSL